MSSAVQLLRHDPTAPFTDSEPVAATGDTTIAGASSSRAIYVGVTGDLDITIAGGTRDIYKNVPVGLFSAAIITVHGVSTTTTASELILVW